MSDRCRLHRVLPPLARHFPIRMPHSRATLHTYSQASAEAGRASAVGKQISRPPIIFVRTIGQSLRHNMPEGMEGSAAGEGDGSGLFYEERPSEFLETVVKPSPVLHWASSLIQRDEDGVLRNWRLYEPTCLEQAPNVVPSVALLSWALIRQPPMDGEPFSVQRFLAEFGVGSDPRQGSASTAMAPHGVIGPSPGPSGMAVER